MTKTGGMIWAPQVSLILRDLEAGGKPTLSSFEGWGRHFKLRLRFQQSLSFKLRTNPKLASCTVVIRPSRATTPNDPWLESCWSLDTLE
jgi:hypothetical protein